MTTAQKTERVKIKEEIEKCESKIQALAENRSEISLKRILNKNGQDSVKARKLVRGIEVKISQILDQREGLQNSLYLLSD